MSARNGDVSEDVDALDSANAMPDDDDRSQMALASTKLQGPCVDAVLTVVSVFQSHVTLRA